jgi:uncharacterized membrane protein YphA (DoxX/SURF4 family)
MPAALHVQAAGILNGMALKSKISRKHVEHWDSKLIDFFGRTYIPVARFSLFVVFFWFGFIKLTGMSPASELAEALTAKTIGEEWFDLLFRLIAFLECLVGILFLIPKAVRIVVPLLFFHMAVVCAPLVLVPEMTWQSFMVPTLEGQYIIKNIVVIAVAFGIAAHTEPLRNKTS